VTDDSTDDSTTGPTPQTNQSSASDARPNDPRANPVRYGQRNLANRLFPGPSREMSQQFAEHVQGLLEGPDGEKIQAAIRERNEKRQAAEAARGAKRARNPAIDSTAPAPAPELLNVATPEDIAQVREALDQQSELLRAILASSVDTQTDARATAQNSRTFAWAGTAIALLTLIATIISIVAAIRA
jgi:hypothetical protein